MNRRYGMVRMIGIVLFGLWGLCQGTGVDAATTDRMTPEERVQAGKALWEEKCRSVAGEKIYRKVEKVEGLLLMKVRLQAGEREWSDQMWPGAAFAREA